MRRHLILLLCLGSFAALALPSAASAAGPANCPASGKVCLYDGKFWTGAIFLAPCNASGIYNLPASFTRKTSSVINRCTRDVLLFYTNIVPRDKQKRIVRQTWVGDLGGTAGFDNRTQGIAYPPS